MFLILGVQGVPVQSPAKKIIITVNKKDLKANFSLNLSILRPTIVTPNVDRYLDTAKAAPKPKNPERDLV